MKWVDIMPRSNVRIAVLATAAFVMSGPDAAASGFGFFGWAYGVVGTTAKYSGNPIYCHDDVGASNAFCGITVAGSLSEALGDSGLASGVASAAALIGSLGVRASVGTDGTWDTDYAVFLAGASFYDTIRVYQATPGGGYLSGDVTISGQLAASQANIGVGSFVPLWGGDADQSPYWFAPWFNNPVGVPMSGPSLWGAGAGLDTGGGGPNTNSHVGVGFDSQGNFSSYSALPGSLHLETPYSANSFDSGLGEWYADTSIGLYIRAYAGCYLSGQKDDYGTCASDSNFAGTLKLTGLQALDPSHNPIADATLVAESGHDYSSVPEPGSLLLLVAGASALGLRQVLARVNAS